MIQANELRIGNWVQGEPFSNPKWGMVSDGRICLTAYGIHSIYSSDEHAAKFSPIPLTPEVLEKCGFEYNKIDGVARLSDVDDPDPEGDTEYWELGGLTIVRWGGGDFTLSNSFSFRLRVTIKSLHQLQNLYFALTGEDLPYQQLNP